MGHYLTTFFSGLITLSLGIFVFYFSTNKDIKPKFLVFCLAIAGWNFAGSIMEFQVHRHIVPFLASRISIAFASLVFPAFLDFVFSFPKKDDDQKKTYFIYLFYLLGVISAVISLTSGYVQQFIFDQGGGVLRVFRPSFLYFVLFAIASLLYGLYLLVKKYLAVRSRADRSRLNYLILGIASGFSFAVIFSIILPTIKINRFFYLGELGPLAFVGLTTYGILKYRLMNIVLVLKKTTAYSLITTGITFIYLALIISFEMLFRSIYSGQYSIWMALPAALVIAITFIPMRNYFQGITDQLFFRQSIEYRKILREVTHAISSVTDLKVLFRLIDQTVVRVMCIKTVSVLLLEEKQGHYVVEKTNGLPKTFEGVSLKKDNPLIVYLNEIKEPVRLDELREQFYDQPGKEERGKLAEIIKELENLSSAVAVPSFVKNRLVGVLTLGEKLSEEPYNQEDIELISTMASEAGIAIENAKLYRDIVETKDYLNSIIQNSDDAIFTLDLDGTVLTWNSGAEKIFGRPPVFLSQSETQEFVGRISAGEEIKALEVGINTRERGRVDLLLSCSPIKGAEEKMIGASLILKDISGLKKVDQTKREFLSIVSHELRTPLTPIKGYVSILLQGNIGPLEPRQKNALETVLKNTNHLQDLIESIIDISRLEAGKPLETEKEPFFLEKMIKESVDNAAPSFTAKGIGLSFDHHDGDIAVIGDRKKITQVMDNLLGNSLKFTPAGGAVKVTMNREEGGVRITVSDTGIGLDGKNLFKIFERFFQVDSSYTRATGGIGMGLAIAKEVVEAHGGRIWAESEGPGHGSKFIFTLPLS